MQDNIEFTLNGTIYRIDATHGGFVWDNSRDEESAAYHVTPLESQQDAIAWEAGRRKRYEGSDEEAGDARSRYLNQRTADARGA